MADFADWTSGGGGGGGGGYASLTGTGQASAPGNLTQFGDFEIDSSATTGGVGFKVVDATANSGNPNGVPSIDIQNIFNPTRLITGAVGSSVRPNISVGGGDLQTININAVDFNQSAGLITIDTHDLRMGIPTGGNNASIRCLSTGIGGAFPQLGFFGATPVSLPGVGGSRGGNAALASLCTALANLGLITNSTTP